ncbi:hypothetical protein BG844_22240 [Couchioplanes caeruleus subsp. caeruleus]|uniref:Ricin B lectin domain-containing protein n=2 Tax=Couchioplanes caeruleus TaxID=56438 RepID=A0A1K0GIQ9_9ACTN|nr:hypothetical protein BG844_22240 [Couchioplanes caeruleus subsp. caeruleus]
MPGWDNGSKAAMYDCIDSYYDQWWAPEITPNSTYRLRNYKTGKCLAVSTTSTGNGRPGIQYTCTLNFNDQWWHFWPVA